MVNMKDVDEGEDSGSTRASKGRKCLSRMRVTVSADAEDSDEQGEEDTNKSADDPKLAEGSGNTNDPNGKHPADGTDKDPNEISRPTARTRIAMARSQPMVPMSTMLGSRLARMEVPRKSGAKTESTAPLTRTNLPRRQSLKPHANAKRRQQRFARTRGPRTRRERAVIFLTPARLAAPNTLGAARAARIVTGRSSSRGHQQW